MGVLIQDVVYGLNVCLVLQVRMDALYVVLVLGQGFTLRRSTPVGSQNCGGVSGSSSSGSTAVAQ